MWIPSSWAWGSLSGRGPRGFRPPPTKNRGLAECDNYRSHSPWCKIKGRENGRFVSSVGVTVSRRTLLFLSVLLLTNRDGSSLLIGLSHDLGYLKKLFGWLF